MPQMIECLLASQERMDSQAEAHQEKMASQEATEACPEKSKAGLEETDAIVDTS